MRRLGGDRESVNFTLLQAVAVNAPLVERVAVIGNPKKMRPHIVRATGSISSVRNAFGMLVPFGTEATIRPSPATGQ